MKEYEFVQFLLTPNEKYLGVAEVLLMGKVLLRYKIVAKKDNTGYFPCPPSVKMPPTAAKPDNYGHAFDIDSSSLSKQIESEVMHYVMAVLNAPKPVMQQSAFAPYQPAVQPAQYAAPQAYAAPKQNVPYGGLPQQGQPAYMNPPDFPEPNLQEDPTFTF